MFFDSILLFFIFYFFSELDKISHVDLTLINIVAKLP